jgi:methylmalonyl-CoA mutase N-terminal domain/subunit
MLKAIERGFVQQEIQNAAYDFQQAVDTKQVVVGVNRVSDRRREAFRRAAHRSEVLERKQVERLRALRAKRDKKNGRSQR